MTDDVLEPGDCETRFVCDDVGRSGVGLQGRPDAASASDSGPDPAWLMVGGRRCLSDLDIAVASVSTVQMRWSALDLGEVERLLGTAVLHLEAVVTFLTTVVSSGPACRDSSTSALRCLGHASAKMISGTSPDGN